MLAAMKAEQAKPDNPLHGELSRKDKAMLLMAGEALKSMEADYLALLKRLTDIAQRERAELGQVKMLLDRFTSQ